MQTHLATNLEIASPGSRPALAKAAQTIAVVDGYPGILTFLDNALGYADYSVLVLNSHAHAFADIKHLRPSLVVHCTQLDDPGACNLLTMLKLDAETRDIPVVTLPANEGDEDESADQPADSWPVSEWRN